MTVAQYAPTVTRGSSRWLLLGSLALNLFFVGVARWRWPFARRRRRPGPQRRAHRAARRTAAGGGCRHAARPVPRHRQSIDDARGNTTPRRTRFTKRCGTSRSTSRDARGHGGNTQRAAGLRSGDSGRIRVFGVANVAGGPQSFGQLAARRKTASNRQ